MVFVFFSNRWKIIPHLSLLKKILNRRSDLGDLRQVTKVNILISLMCFLPCSFLLFDFLKFFHETPKPLVSWKQIPLPCRFYCQAPFFLLPWVCSLFCIPQCLTCDLHITICDYFLWESQVKCLNSGHIYHIYQMITFSGEPRDPIKSFVLNNIEIKINYVWEDGICSA